MKYWLVVLSYYQECSGSRVIFGNIQELVSYAISKYELIENEGVFLSHVLGVDGKEHPEILEIIEGKLNENRRRLNEIEERIENSPFKKLKGLFK